MDKEANVKEQIAISKEIIAIWDDCNGDGTLNQNQLEVVADAANRLAELVLSLNEYNSKK